MAQYTWLNKQLERILRGDEDADLAATLSDSPTIVSELALMLRC